MRFTRYPSVRHTYLLVIEHGNSIFAAGYTWRELAWNALRTIKFHLTGQRKVLDRMCADRTSMAVRNTVDRSVLAEGRDGGAG